VWLGTVGYVAKGMAVAVIGVLFLYAAITHQPKSSGGLDQALRDAGVPGLAGIDTRALVRRIRTGGAQVGVLSTDPASEEGEVFKASETLRLSERVVEIFVEGGDPTP